jgi:hypothetical protein
MPFNKQISSPSSVTTPDQNSIPLPLDQQSLPQQNQSMILSGPHQNALPQGQAATADHAKQNGPVFQPPAYPMPQGSGLAQPNNMVQNSGVTAQHSWQYQTTVPGHGRPIQPGQAAPYYGGQYCGLTPPAFLQSGLQQQIPQPWGWPRAGAEQGVQCWGENPYLQDPYMRFPFMGGAPVQYHDPSGGQVCVVL